MIQTERLRKVYASKRHGTVVAVNALDLYCGKGEIYALLGPNGAGKTTTLRILSTLISPTSGAAYVDGYDVTTHKADVRRRLGVVSYETGIYERMTPREIGHYFGRLNDMDDAAIRRNLDYIFSLLRMEEFADTRTETFSTGMRQKTVIMRALVTDPEILLFDEPTAGLDLLTAKNVTEYIRLLKEQGKTIVFSTHILWEAEKLADRIGIIHRGDLIAEGSLAELQRTTRKRDVEDVFFALLERASS
jgi:sodium transport system ATP-binding protein